MYKIEILKDEKKWDRFNKSQDNTLFVQAPEYGEFYRATNEDSWIITVCKEGEIIAGSLVVSVHARRGDFIFLPYGPIVSGEVSKKERAEILQYFFKYIGNFGADKKADFVRVSPFARDSKEEREIYQNAGFRPAPHHILAENTWLLDLEGKSDEQLLSGMKKNHRNLLRRCLREGVKIEMSHDIDDLDGLDELLDVTAKRHDFVRFSRSYIEKEFNALAKNNHAAVFNAYLPDGKLDSSAVIMFYGNMAAYRHSASLNIDRRLPTSYALQWIVIKEARKRGLKYYNFWGVAPEGSKKTHPFYGITHFKKGFGGFQMDLLHCQDLPITRKYWLNWFIESIRKWRRGF
jgi:lipid II:glycine glycyltransferase (peptidoglycan interpeptide bridge formation enzyme)